MQQPFLDKLEDVTGSFKAILLDAYGVFWAGNALGLLPGSKIAMETLVAQGKVVGILSNSTQLSSKEIAKLESHGLLQGKHFHFLLTSGQIANEVFLKQEIPFPTPRKTFMTFGKPHPKFSPHIAIFQDTIYEETFLLEEADFAYISIPHINGEDQIDPKVFLEEILKIKSKNIPMICANPDRFAEEGSPSRFVVRQGSIASLYESLGGQVFYIGKPFKKAYSQAMKQFEKLGIITPSDILMIGDTPETDIRGAKKFGMSSALVIETGVTAHRIHNEGKEKTLENLSEEQTPNFFIKRFSYDV